LSIVILTAGAVPYQVEFFSAIAKQVPLSVIYMVPLEGSRPWTEQRGPFPEVCLAAGTEAARTASRWIADAGLVVFNWYRGPQARRLMRERARSGRPWVFWGEALGFHFPRPLGMAFRHFAMRPLHRGRAPIWCIGSWAIESYRREFGTARRYESLPYFSDLARFAAPSSPRREGDVRTLLYSGQLAHRKGVDLVVRAAHQLLPGDRRLKLSFAGDGPLRSDVNALARRFPDQVKVWGFVPWRELPRVYSECDVLLAPSRYDGWNLAVPEGLAAGLPAISTDQTGAAIDLIRPGQNGWVIRAGDAAALKGAMEAAIAAPALGEMQRLARRTAESHSLEVGARRFASYAKDASLEQ
jgi:glycosyltransferase involved in cell wall biosynthesis